MRQFLHEIFILLGPDKNKVPKFLALFLSISALDVAGIGLIGPYVAIISQPKNGSDYIQILNQWMDGVNSESLIVILSLALLCIFVVKAIAGIWINYTIIRFSEDQQIRLRSSLMKVYQSLPYEEYLSRNSSEYIHNVGQLVSNFSQNVVAVLLKAISEGLVAIAILSYLAWVNFMAFILLTGLLTLMIVLYDQIFRKNLNIYGEKVNDSSISILKGIQEGIEGLKELRILGSESYFYQQVLNSSKTYSHFYSLKRIISIVPRYLLELAILGFIILLVLITLELKQNTQEVLPTIAVFGLASIRLLPTANIISRTLMQLRFHRNSISRLYYDVNKNHLKMNSNTEESSEYIKPFDNLHLENVSFRYSNAKYNALECLSLHIEAGDSIGFIGPSGSGKTTLIDVFLGLLEPQKGCVSYNGEPLNKCLKDWTKHVAYLPQQVFLTDNTLRNNIALGINNEEIDEGLLNDAICKARLVDLVDRLPKGLDTLLGERGVRISGGQKQRIALARAFYYERDVLIMDESTSALDNETENEIIEEIQLFKNKKTIIVIAHRLTTLKNCDKIYEISGGKILRSGPYSEMCQKN